MVETTPESAATTRVEALRRMSQHELAQLGAPTVAYIRAAEFNGESGFTIYAADGTPLAFTHERDTAFAAARQRDLHPVSVH